jgi:hypothetical protein
MDPATDLIYKTLVHYKVGPRWYTGQTNSYAVDADSSTTADVVIRPPPYYLCKTENDYSVSAGQNVTITFTLFDVRNYLWQAQTGGNPCNDAKNRSAGFTITVQLEAASMTPSMTMNQSVEVAPKAGASTRVATSPLGSSPIRQTLVVRLPQSSQLRAAISLAGLTSPHS